MKEAAKFSREAPVTKVEIHNAFFDVGLGQYIQKPVVEVKRVTGDNSPKYLVKNGYLEMHTIAQVDYYQLTEEGEEWLREGLMRYIELHPERAVEVNAAASGHASSIKRRTRPATAPQSPAKVPIAAPQRRIIRRSAPR